MSENTFGSRSNPLLPHQVRRVIEAPKRQGREMGEKRRLWVGREIALSGEIRSCDTIGIDGEVSAEIADCRGMDISEAGTFKGSADVAVADIAGRFDGELTVRERLILRSTGRIIGTIRYAAMEIEHGGRIEGTMELLPEGDAKNAAQKPNLPAPR